MADVKNLAKVRDIDLVNTFTQSIDKLAAMLSTCEPIQAAPGETLHQKHITGKLSTDAYVEGQDIPLSNYTWEDVQTYEVEIKPYRKQATLTEIKKRGYEAAIDKTDAAMVSDIQANIKKGFVDLLATGTATATGATLAACAANCWAELSNKVEEHGFGDVEAVFLANPVDFAKCIGDSEVYSAFGIAYIENWSGLGTLISTGTVPAGTIYATVKSNVKLYFAASEGDDVFGFYTDESGYIAIQHAPELKSLTYDTVAYVGIKFFAEYIDFVVKGSIVTTA